MGSYVLPSPLGSERNRLDLQHQAFRATLGGKLLSSQPHSGTHRVLDMGTGTGIWALEFARENASAEVIGFDLNLPEVDSAPANCSFAIHDIQKEWDTEKTRGSFDLIFGRMTLMNVPRPDNVLAHCFENLKPGGIIEIQEMMGPWTTDLSPDHPDYPEFLIGWCDNVTDGAAILGVNFQYSAGIPNALEAAGFENVRVEDHQWPCGPWSEDDNMKKVGELYLECSKLGAMALSDKPLAKGLGWSNKDVQKYVETLLKELEDEAKVKRGRVYMPVRIVCAEKPRA